MARSPSRAARLRDRVRFERKGKAENVGGVVRAAWERLFGPVAVELKPLAKGSGELVLAARVEGVERFEAMVRGSSNVRDLTTDDRVVDARDETRVFGILHILNPDMKGRDYVLLLERGKANG